MTQKINAVVGLFDGGSSEHGVMFKMPMISPRDDKSKLCAGVSQIIALRLRENRHRMQTSGWRIGEFSRARRMVQPLALEKNPIPRPIF